MQDGGSSWEAAPPMVHSLHQRHSSVIVRDTAEAAPNHQVVFVSMWFVFCMMFVFSAVCVCVYQRLSSVIVRDTAEAAPYHQVQPSGFWL